MPTTLHPGVELNTVPEPGLKSCLCDGSDAKANNDNDGDKVVTYRLRSVWQGRLGETRIESEPEERRTIDLCRRCAVELAIAILEREVG